MEESKNYINLLGKKIPIFEEFRKISELNFYKENPRIASIIQKEKQLGNIITDELIDEKLWGIDGTHKIFRRIQKHGGLINPVVVYKNEVIEGNTRLCAYRHLYKIAVEENDDPQRWEMISCKVLLEQLSNSQIYALLGDEHIVGKIEWGTFEKALWMNQMLEEQGFNIEDVKKVTGLSEPTIYKYVGAYKTMIKENVGDPKKFSHFEQLVGNSAIKDIEKKTDPDIKKKVIVAIKSGQINQAMDVRKIPVVWKDKNSRKKFISGENIDQVYSELKAKVPTIDNVFIKVLQDVYDRMRKLKRADLEQLSCDGKCRLLIKKVAKESKSLSNELENLKQVPSR
jgi:hypothetical protein